MRDADDGTLEADERNEAVLCVGDKAPAGGFDAGSSRGGMCGLGAWLDERLVDSA